MQLISLSYREKFRLIIHISQPELFFMLILILFIPEFHYRFHPI